MTGYYLMFNRDCSQALETYEKAFETKVIQIIKYGDLHSNLNVPIADSDKELVLHAKIKINDIEIMCADTTSETLNAESMYIKVTTKDCEFVKNAWGILKEKGTILSNLEPSFFAKLHGSLQDEYGIKWLFTIKNDMLESSFL